MQREDEYVLEQSRKDKIKDLGFLCYNLYVDGAMGFTEIRELVKNIKDKFNEITVLRKNNVGSDYLKMQEFELNEKLVELGCVCYNLYVDNRLFNNKVLSLCDSICSINHEMTNGFKVSEQYEYPESCENPELLFDERKNVTQSKLKVTYPYGMEPIPTDFKKCLCGYRNKSIARFCGKCGAKLS